MAVENPPADASALRWMLIEILEKTAVTTSEESGNPMLRAWKLEAFGAAADLGRIGGARRAFESEILSRAGATTRSAGERHLSALYGDDAGPAGLSRFSRDVRDGVFDGACAQGARVLIVGWLEETLAAGEAASDTAS